MSSGVLIVLELSITLGLVVGWGVWELRQLKKDKANTARRNSQ